MNPGHARPSDAGVGAAGAVAWTPTVRLLTPVRNGASFIGDTVRSIVGQAAVREGRVLLDYSVLDAESTDGTVDAASAAAEGAAEVISAPDVGMYDALARGFRQRSGDICGYVNAGDILLPGALDVLYDVLAPGRASWVCGYQVQMTERGELHGAVLPYRFSRDNIRRGLHNGRLPFVQQESTFWRGELLGGVDLDRFAAQRLAGDYYLWAEFARSAELVVVDALLGAFRTHPDQQSEDLAGYLEEVRALSAGARPWVRAATWGERLLWRAPNRLKKAMNQRNLWLYDPEAGTWR